MTDDEFDEWVRLTTVAITALKGTKGDTVTFSEPVPHPDAPPEPFFVPNARLNDAHVKERIARPGVVRMLHPPNDDMPAPVSDGVWFESRHFVRQWSVKQSPNGTWGAGWGWYGVAGAHTIRVTGDTLAEVLRPVRRFRETELRPPPPTVV